MNPSNRNSSRKNRRKTVTSSNSTDISTKQSVQIELDNNEMDVVPKMLTKTLDNYSSDDSAATEMMISDMHTLNIIDTSHENDFKTQRNQIRRRSRRLQAQRNFSSSTSSTDPCEGE